MLGLFTLLVGGAYTAGKHIKDRNFEKRWDDEMNKKFASWESDRENFTRKYTNRIFESELERLILEMSDEEKFAILFPIYEDFLSEKSKIEVDGIRCDTTEFCQALKLETTYEGLDICLRGADEYVKRALLAVNEERVLIPSGDAQCGILSWGYRYGAPDPNSIGMEIAYTMQGIFMKWWATKLEERGVEPMLAYNIREMEEYRARGISSPWSLPEQCGCGKVSKLPIITKYGWQYRPITWYFWYSTRTIGWY